MAKSQNFSDKNNIKTALIKDFIPEDYDIIINATTVGMNENKSILKSDQVLSKHIIMDMIYSPLETTLLKIARKNYKRR